MVSREKVIEEQLDDVRNFVIALIIGVVISIPITVFVQGIKHEYRIAFLAYCIGLFVTACTLYYVLKNLYEEYSRDPGMVPYLGVFAIVITLLALIVLIIAMLL